MHFRVSCIVDDLVNKMCDEPITYDLARSSVVHVFIQRQTPTGELTKIVPVVASCTTSLDLNESEGRLTILQTVAPIHLPPYRVLKPLSISVIRRWVSSLIEA
jgi:hypothetical protein